MSKTVTSNSITFIDNTDNRKIEVFIASNLPTTQIYNTNTGAYSPDWSSTPLTLTPTVYLDSTNITSSATIQWKRKYGANAAENISTNQTLSRSTNELSHSSGIVTYICVATYQNMTAQAQVTFVRADTGTNGAQGADGTSVTILDTAYANTTVTVGNYYDLYSDSAATIPISTTGLNDGDSYLVSGYLCVYNTTQQKFLCVGKIQGPQGEPGENAKLITLSSNSQIFKVNKLGTISPSTISVTGTAVNTSISSWRYSTDGGVTYNTSATGVSRSGNVVTITGANITSNSITIKASDGINADIFTVYKVADGTDGTDGAQGIPAPIAFLTNEHISFVANSNGQVAGQTVTTNIVAYNGTTKVTPVLGTISGLPTGMTINTVNITTVANELIIPITIANNATFGSNSSNNGTITIPITSPVSTNLKLNWSKVNAGADGSAGVGISAIAEHYAVSTSNTTAPTTWQDNPPVMTVTNKYLWNYETITYTNNTTHDTEKRVIGVYGNTGNAGSSVSISSTSVTYQAGSSGTSQPTGTWTTTIPTVDNGKYLWTKTAVAYSNGTSTEAYSVSYKGTNGSDGTSVTISSTAVTYQASTSGTNVPTGVWNASIPSVANGQFLWTRTIVTYSNNTSTTSYSVSYSGINGNDAYTVILSNESHTFAGTTSAAIASSTKCEVFAYKGSTRVAATIGAISGLPTGMTAPITSNGTTSAYFSPTVTTSMTTTSGVLTIPITVDGKSFPKTFSYALSLKGDTGSKGDTGTSASLVDITPSALYFKSTTGKDGTFNPEYIYLYPRFQTVTYSNWQYSINGGSTWVNASGANGLTIGTYNSVANSLRISRSSTLYTDAVTSISFRCNSSNGSVYDTVSIAKIYDVVDLQIGGRNLLRYTKNFPITYNASTGIHQWGNVKTLSATNDGIKVTFDGTDNACLGIPLVYDGAIDNNEQFTLSFDYRGNITDAGQFYFIQRTSPNVVFNMNSVGGTLIANTTEWQHYSFSYSIPNANDRVCYDILLFYSLKSYNSANWIEIKKSSLQLEHGNKATDWTPAPEDIASEISNAQNTANTANTAISNMANDNILTPAEKTELKREYSIITSEKSNIDAQANVYSNVAAITTAKNNYNTAYNNIVNNVNPIINASGDSSINGSTFRGYFSDYYAKKEALLSAILNATKGYTDSIEVGGRNLIKNSTFKNNLNGWTASNVTTTFNSDNVVGNYMTFIATQPGDSSYRMYTADSNFKHSPNETYTLSFYAKADENTQLQSNVAGGSNPKNYSLTTSWQKFTYTYMTSITGSLTFWAVSANKKVYLSQVKLEKGNKVTDYTTAPEDIDTQITVAQTTANTANQAISDMSSDNIITPTEKVSLKREYDSIVAEKVGIDAQANIYSTVTAVNTAKTAYNTAYNNIVNNVSVVVNASGNSTVTGTTFRGYFSNYYAKKEELLSAILNASKGYTDAIEIGGNNIATKTNQGDIGWNWGMQVGSYTKTSVTEDGINCAKLERTAAEQSGWSYISYSNIGRDKYLPNTTYTISFEVKASVQTTFNVLLMEGNASNPLAANATSTAVSKTAYANKWSKIEYRIITVSSLPASTNQVLYLNEMDSRPGVSYIFRNVKIEKGNKATDWSPAPEDMYDKINTASGIIAMLSNEAHFFMANASGVPTATSTVLDVIGYKGSTQQNTTVGTITGLPSAGMTATISNNSTQNTKITVAVTTALTSAVADSGTLTIPITIDGKTINKIFSWSKSKDGSAAKLINLSASGQIFKVASNGTVTPSTLTVSAEVQNTTASAWTYSVNGGSFSSTAPTGVSRSGNTVTITGSTMTANSISIRASDGTNSDVVTVSKVSDGNGISSITNYYLATASASGVTTSTAGWTTSVQTTTESKKYLWNYEVINYTNGTNFTSSTRIIGTYGSKGTNAIAFQLYAPNGYVLSDELPTITLQTFAYDGSTAITSGATYKWYKWIDNAWSEMYGSTSASISITRQDVFVSQTYKCEMTYKGVVYSATETVEDRGDAYESVLCTANSDIIGANARFIIAYVLTYNQNGEVDALLGPISRVAPSDATSGSYWYAIDESAETVTLKKYNGTTWSNSTDSQSFTYDWNIGGIGKVKVIKKSDISIATNVQCDVILNELGIVTRCNQLFYDTSDPVVSSSEPSVKFDGQIWIKTYENGTFSMYTWSANDNKWIVSESDSRQKIFTKKPGNYQIGDLWLVGTDYIPSGFTSGVLLKAKDANLTYADSNWVDETVYAQQISQLKESVDKYNQYFNFTTENGLQIRAKDSNNNPSRFYTQLTNSELGFYQDNDKVAYINNHKMNITEADINIVNTPLLKIGNFSFIVESNGSMSIVTNN